MAFGRRDSDDYDDRPPRFGLGGDWHGLRPSFDNPMSWSLPLFRAFRIAVRVHIVFVLYVIIELLRSEFSPSKEAPPLGFLLMAQLMAMLFVIVLLHEFGHCFACRWTQGAADEILMWPLGGLAYCKPEHNWRSHFITAAGGPMVNVVICAVCGVALGGMTGKWLGVALPNPFDLSDPLYELEGWLLTAIYLVNATSLILLLFNLLPLFPLDGGRLLQAALWPKFGYAQSMRYAVRIGFIGAVLLGVLGVVMANWMLVAIAVFGGLTCYQTIRQLNFTNEMLGFESDEYLASSRDESDEVESAGRTRREAKQEEAMQREAEQVDAILAKIKKSGMESLSWREKKLLRKATERGKGGQ